MNIRLFYSGMSVVLAFLFYSGNAAAAEFCDDAYYINQSMSNGARWDMCWTEDRYHGIRYHHIHYTPRNKTRRMVLRDAAVAQIHVTYDAGSRAHDVSDFGLGGFYMQNITSKECNGGTRRLFGTKNAICIKAEKQTTSFRSEQSSQESQVLKVFSISSVGAYTYQPIWSFFDDGRIEPSITATGSLQNFSPNRDEPYGWVMASSTDPSRNIGDGHAHNLYWRLDFDLNGTNNNDLAQEINTTTSGGQRRVSVTTFNNEAGRSLSPSNQRTWMIRDGAARNAKGHLMGYEIRLDQAGQRDVGPDFEPFTRNDFYVTRARSCERFASHNNSIFPCETKNLAEFVSGESINGQDIVVWAGVSFYHMPRSEDHPKMDSHNNRLQIIPRDWHASNPVTDQVIDPISSPLAANPDSANASSNTITIDVLANDTGSGLTLQAPNAWSLNGGKVALVNNKLNYTAKPGFNGTDKIWYIVKDSLGSQASSVVNITVIGNGGVIDVPPVANQDTVAVTSANQVTINPLANDAGTGLILQAPSAWSLKGGRVALVSNQLRYTPKPGFNGEDKIWYSILDSQGRGGWSVIIINVSGNGATNNDVPPSGSPDNVTTTTGATVTIDVLANDMGSGLVLTAPNPWSLKGGNVSLVSNKLVYKSKAGFIGSYNIWYTFSDSQGRTSNGQVNITVIQSNTTSAPFPIANADTYTVPRNSTRTLDILNNDTPSTGILIDTLYEYSSKGGKTTKINGREVSYTPKVGFTGIDDFWYVMADSQGRKNSAKVTITVSP